MPDVTYPSGGQGVYRTQGGKNIVVGSSGTLTIETGGTLAITTGATVSLSSGTPLAVSGSTGVVIIDDGGQLAFPVTVKSTTSGTISNFGVTTFGTTIASAYTLTGPTVPGLVKWLFCTVGGASAVNAVVTTATSNSYIRNSTAVAGDTHTLTFTESGDYAALVAVTTSEWRVFALSGATLS